MKHKQTLIRIESAINETIKTLEFLKQELSVLKKEFEDGGVSLNSAREGSISEQERDNILKKRKRALIKKAT